ncbi:hypothetical protein [Rhizobium herbae]
MLRLSQKKDYMSLAPAVEGTALADAEPQHRHPHLIFQPAITRRLNQFETSLNYPLHTADITR